MCVGGGGGKGEGVGIRSYGECWGSAGGGGSLGMQ